MNKAIVFCSDGTGRSPRHESNVSLVHEHLSENSHQMKCYDAGVGSRWGELLGLAIGRGLSANIRDGYRFVCRHYEADDRIYLFGFSRGAYTVRSLASLIALCGVVKTNDHELNSAVKKVFRAYKKNRNELTFWSQVDRLRKQYSFLEGRIEAICVWDTVGSVGRQTRTRDVRKKLWHRFHRMTIYPNVKRYYHAVSLDERRTQYFPHLSFGQATPSTHVEEVWFPGVHSDVGGGCYKERELADVTFKWMLSKVTAELDLAEDLVEKTAYRPCGPMHNVEGGLIFSFFQKRTRPVRRDSVLHRSVVDRINGPLDRFHPHREPSGNYEPLALSLANYSSPPTFGIKDNYQVTV